MADAVIIDEAHHSGTRALREPGPRRRRGTGDSTTLLEDKDLFLLTATPINNRLDGPPAHDRAVLPAEGGLLQGRAPRHPQPTGALLADGEATRRVAAGQQPNGRQAETNQVEAEEVLAGDDLFRALVVQRSRAYVKRSQEQQGGTVGAFPERSPRRWRSTPSRRPTASLLDDHREGVQQGQAALLPGHLLPLAYYKGPKENIDTFSEGRQKQVVGLIRTLFLKRFESSARAFELSCQTLLKKLLAFVTKNSQTSSEKSRLERWMAQNAELIGYVQQTQFDLDGAGRKTSRTRTSSPKRC